MPGFVLSLGMKAVASSVKSKANFNLEKVAPIRHVDKAFIPAQFAHALGDDFILPSHSEELHEKYSGEKNYTTFEGDHNSPRPQFFLDSVVIFFINSLRVNELIPQTKIKYGEPEPSLPSLGSSHFNYFDDDDGYGAYNQDVTDEDLLEMAIKESMKTKANLN